MDLKKNLEKKYILETAPFKIGEKTLTLYQVKNWEVFLDGFDLSNSDAVKNFPFWIKVWKASLAFTYFLLQKNFDQNLEILEVGAGMGLPGLFLGAEGFNTTITDFDEDALKLLELNRKTNHINNVTIKKLDWYNPDSDKKYDIICGSELIYNETVIESLLELFNKALKPGGTVFLAHGIVVNGKNMKLFINKAGDKFNIDEKPLFLRGENITIRLLIHTLKRI